MEQFSGMWPTQPMRWHGKRQLMRAATLQSYELRNVNSFEGAFARIAQQRYCERMSGNSDRNGRGSWRIAMPRSSRKARILIDDTSALRSFPHAMQCLQIQLLSG